MNTQVESLVKQARSLSPEDQAVLTEALYEMVNPTDPEWESAWNLECKNRLEAYQRGEIKALDSAEAMQLMSNKYGLK
ncbi:MAG: addiction module protein [Sideroxydans sp.]|nr:addiction module protein [Sideroxydans sp.]